MFGNENSYSNLIYQSACDKLKEKIQDERTKYLISSLMPNYGSGTLAMYPKKSAIWPVPSFPETGHNNQITILFKKVIFLKQLSWSLAAQSRLGFPKT
jgi:hypothetical protein